MRSRPSGSRTARRPRASGSWRPGGRRESGSGRTRRSRPTGARRGCRRWRSSPARESPRAISGAVTSRHRELMARLAARLGAGIAADCVAFSLADGQLVATRPVYAGKLLVEGPLEDGAVGGDAAAERVQGRGGRDGQGARGRAPEPGRGDPGDPLRRAARGGADGPPRADRGRDRRVGRPGAEGPGELRAPRGAGGGHRRRGRGVARGRGRRVEAAPLPDRPDGPDHLAEALHRLSAFPARSSTWPGCGPPRSSAP